MASPGKRDFRNPSGLLRRRWHHRGRAVDHVSSGEVAATLLVLACASMVQATAGFGFALLSMPLLSTIIGPPSALAVTSLVAIVNSGTTAIVSRTEADRTLLRRLVVAAIVGMPAGLWLLETVSVRTMQLVISATVALSAVLLGSGLRLRRVGATTDIAAGLLSGALGTSTGTSGPPIVISLQSRALPAATLRATISTQFAATGWIGVVLLSVRGHVDRADVLVALAALPVLLVSWTIGARSFRRLTQTHYDALVVVLLLVAAGVGAVRAL
jgi:uncharacterized membrane protein YfcA